MALFNYAAREITAKIVYYGPALCGKTANLRVVYNKIDPQRRGHLVSLETEGDRTLFFDLLPIEIGTIKGFKIKFQLYTVPGQVFYNATRKLVLNNTDAVVFVADSQIVRKEANVESLANLRDNLKENGVSLESMPWIIQVNKRDLQAIDTVENILASLGNPNVPYVEAVAVDGIGVFETLKIISKMLVRDLEAQLETKSEESRTGGLLDRMKIISEANEEKEEVQLISEINQTKNREESEILATKKETAKIQKDNKEILFDISKYQVTPENKNLIPLDLIEHFSILPLNLQGNTLNILMIDPNDSFIIDELKIVTGKEIRGIKAQKADILKMIDKYFKVKEEVKVNTAQEMTKRKEEEKKIVVNNPSSTTQKKTVEKVEKFADKKPEKEILQKQKADETPSEEKGIKCYLKKILEKIMNFFSK